jgi:hypothetical protein
VRSIPLAQNLWASCGVQRSHPQRWCSLRELISWPSANMSRLEPQVAFPACTPRSFRDAIDHDFIFGLKIVPLAFVGEDERVQAMHLIRRGHPI